jgi:hypothetical protein
MKRSLMLIAVLALLGATAGAQAPQGWMLRADRSTNAADPDAPGEIRFTTSGAGFHAVTPQAAVFWHPSNTATGNYSVKGTFTLLKPSSHPNYYGLVFGGRELEGRGQTYLYFVVAQNGTWLIKRRDGDAATQDIATRAASPAIKRPDASGRSVNTLEVRVAADKVDYLVNETVVHSTARSGLVAQTDGLYGVRSNHDLDIQIDALAMTKR